jgi:hypothetical protein
MEKLFACIWGAWEKAECSYEPEVKTENLEALTESQGYSEHDVTMIEGLGLGTIYRPSGGNHIVIRIQ